MKSTTRYLNSAGSLIDEAIGEKFAGDVVATNHDLIDGINNEGHDSDSAVELEMVKGAQGDPSNPIRVCRSAVSFDLILL